MKLLLHPVTAKRFARVATDQNASQLWSGPEHVGKLTAAMELTRVSNCADGGHDLCIVCRQIDSGNYPDLIILRLTDKASIGIERIRELTGELGLKTYRPGARRFIVIEQADTLTLQSQNALLKAIEEPPPATTFILLAVDEQAILPTVRSRCQITRFIAPGVDVVAKTLVAEMGISAEQASVAAEMADGLPGLAIDFASNPELASVWSEQDILARQLITAGIFERLVAVRELHERKIDLVQFGRRVIVHVRRSARAGASVRSEPLEASARFFERLAGGVGARAALEGLLLEL